MSVFRYGLKGDAWRFPCAMTENARLNRYIYQIDFGFVEREATPHLLMKLCIQIYLARLSLSNTLSIFEVFSIERARSTFTTGFTRLIYGRRRTKIRITLLSMRP